MLEHVQVCHDVLLGLAGDWRVGDVVGGTPVLREELPHPGGQVDHPEDFDTLDLAPAWNSGHCLVIHVVFGQILNRFGQWIEFSKNYPRFFLRNL